LRPSGGYNAILPPIIGNFMPPKPDLVFHTAPIAIETNHSAFTVQIAPSFVQSTEQVKHPRHSVQPNNIDAAQSNMVTTAEVNREVTTDN
nr:hypothetical protein [Tanacetum cinerariifolium]